MTSSCGGEEGEIGGSSKEDEAVSASESGRDVGSGSGTGTTGRDGDGGCLPGCGRLKHG